MTHQSTANRDPAVAQQIGRDYALGLLATVSGSVEVAYTMLRRVPNVQIAGYIANIISDCDDKGSVDRRAVVADHLRQLAIQAVSNQAYENAFAGDAQRSVASLTVPVPTLEFCDNEQVDATLRSRLDGLGIDYPTYQHFTNAYTLLREFVSGLRCAGVTIKPAFYDALKRAEDAACQKFGIPF